MHSERHEELVALAALGPPSGQDATDYARLLEEGCSECETLLPQLRLAATALSVSAPPLAPRPELREAILASLGPSRPAARPSSAPWVFAAAAALLFVVVLFDDARLRREREELRAQNSQLAGQVASSRAELSRRDLRARVMESDDVRVLFLGGQGPQPRARGKVFWSEGAKRGVLVAGGLEPLPVDRQYQLWVFVDGKPVDAGVFDADAAGRALFESRDLAAVSAAENFAVTVEPRGGVPAPTGPIVLMGQV
ncbi:MAG TPA: anti-sigma factor [Thermoanaerobaculia bacterium]|nr:anti-sigma factor [Thermoanaerobaculia bacterium]